MEIAGYLAAAFIGLALGLIGGGGSILTVPVLVYLFGIDMTVASAYSLFIVGATSLVGSWQKYRAGLVELKTALVFGLPSIVAVYLTRAYLVPAIPEVMAEWGGLEIGRNLLLMLLFAALMVFAAFSMIRPGNTKSSSPETGFRYGLILLEGSVVGVLTGLVGAGGGFLIIPALVLFTGLSMKKAVGTSLVIIAAKSLLGFTGDLGHLQPDWTLLLSVTALAIAGIFIGNRLADRIDGEKLKKGFGWFVLVMGIYILLKELMG
jgi:uncharacterized membrane protein YfcA